MRCTALAVAVVEMHAPQGAQQAGLWQDRRRLPRGESCESAALRHPVQLPTSVGKRGTRILTTGSLRVFVDPVRRMRVLLPSETEESVKDPRASWVPRPTCVLPSMWALRSASIRHHQGHSRGHSRYLDAALNVLLATPARAHMARNCRMRVAALQRRASSAAPPQRALAVRCTTHSSSRATR